MKRFFALVALLCTVMISSTALAIGSVANSDEILADMYVHPANYIHYGGASTGLSFFIVKSSLNVELYAPPNYIISAREITHFNSGEKGASSKIIKTSIIRYKYDYAAKKMYMEWQDQNKSVSWKYLNPANNKSYHDDNFVAAGEFLFYFAYNMSFYDKPAMHSFKQFLAKSR